jgi:hypothetical protein
MLLITGLSNAQTGNIFGDTASIEKQISKYAETIMHIFNNNILGDEDGPAQWTIPMDEGKKTVGTICLDNNRIRKVISNFETLMSVSLVNPAQKLTYETIIPHYRSGMEIL